MNHWYSKYYIVKEIYSWGILVDVINKGEDLNCEDCIVTFDNDDNLFKITEKELKNIEDWKVTSL